MQKQSWLLTPLLVLFLCAARPALQSQILTVEASYVLAPQETPSIAEARLVQKVRHMAVDRAATDLMTAPVVRNAGLSSDQVRVLAGAVMKTRIVRTTREQGDEGETLVVKMQATITTEGLEAAIPKVQTSQVVSTYLRLQDLYERVHQAIEDGNSGSGTWIEKLRELEQIFLVNQLREQAFFSQLLAADGPSH